MRYKPTTAIENTLFRPRSHPERWVRVIVVDHPSKGRRTAWTGWALCRARTNIVPKPRDSVSDAGLADTMPYKPTTAIKNKLLSRKDAKAQRGLWEEVR